MTIEYDDAKLQKYFAALKQAIESGNDQVVFKVHSQLDNYIRVICENDNLRPSAAKLQTLKNSIDDLSILAANKKQSIGLKSRQQKQNAKAIAKYRSV
jgi:hypothetical protein